MKKLKLKNIQGITLIALVITIIVLLILAGVAISMLSGENGILARASEAKEKTEEAKIEEASALFSYEMALQENSKYKLQYGYLTGFEYDREQGHTVETVAEVEAELPDGYKIISKYKFNINKLKGEDVSLNEEDKYISTGMVIAKDGQEVARTVLFGDVTCDGIMNTIDIIAQKKYIFFREGDFQDFQRTACNVILDKELDVKDIKFLTRYIVKREGFDVNQQQNITTSGKNLKRLYTELQQYISLLNEEETEYKFEYNEETDTYKLKGVKKGITVESLISKLPDIYEIKVIEQTIDEENKLTSSEIASDAEVMNGYYIQLEWEYTDSEGGTITVSPTFAYIEVEE